MNDYPCEEDLEKIRNWPETDLKGLMEFVKSIWSEYGTYRVIEPDIHVFATGGWSGNEDIIYALKNNQMFWLLYWAESARGGRHIFAPCNVEVIDKLHDMIKVP